LELERFSELGAVVVYCICIVQQAPTYYEKILDVSSIYVCVSIKHTYILNFAHFSNKRVA